MVATADVGIMGKMWRVLRNMYESVESSVLVNDDKTDRFQIETGVRQGCILSPILFNIFIDGVTKQINRQGVGVKIQGRDVSILLFADDIVLIAEGPERLQKMLDLVYEYSRKWRFSFNIGKSNVVIFQKRGRRPADIQFQMGGEVLEQKKSYKYLGVDLEDELGWKETKRRLVDKARKKAIGVWGLGVSQGLSVKAGVNCWETLVRPVLEYGAEVWGRGEWEEAKRVPGDGEKDTGSVGGRRQQR